MRGVKYFVCCYSSQETFVRDDKFVEFFRLNMSPVIVAKRRVRQKVRALSRWGGKIYFPFSRVETETVRDGTTTETYTDAEGRESQRQKPNYSTVSFECSYQYGTINVAVESTKPMAAGFLVTMRYNDGHGEVVLPNTGKVHRFRDRSATMGSEHIGLTDDMIETGILFIKWKNICFVFLTLKLRASY